MALYQHKFIGQTALGTTFMHTLWTEVENESLPIQDRNANAVTWLETFMDGAAGVFPPEVVYTSVSTSQIDEDTRAQVARYDTAVTIAGTEATGQPLPAEVAVVVSLMTNTPTRSGRGRFYLPQMTSAALSDSGRIAASTITTLVGALEDAFGSLPLGDVAVIWSRTQSQTRPITGFNIGDLWDTIRGRDARAIETRVTGEV